MEANLKTGDVIKTTCHNIPMCFHVGVCVVEKDEVHIYHCTPSTTNSKGGNVVCQTLTEFMKLGDNVREMIDVYSTNLKEHQIKKYSERNADKKWDAIEYNCETFINNLLKNGIQTTQLERGLIIGIVALAVFLFITNDKD